VSEWREDLLGGLQVISMPAIRRRPGDTLYHSHPPEEEEVTATAIPYALWAHRGEGEMRVWVHER
jgi:DUF1680 family protein